MGTNNNRGYKIIFIVVFVISLSFAMYTKHAWEDWFITYRVSKNLATGKGLAYTAGEKVQASTSPIGTLLPAAFNLITFNSSDELALWLYRIIGCLLLGLSAVLMLKIAGKNSLHWLSTILLIGMFSLSVNIIDFSINGMEVAFMMFFLVSNIYVLTMSSRNISLKLGLVWAGLMWTRPDGFVYFGALSIGYLLFNPTLANVNSRRALFKLYIKAGIVLVVLYLPWVLWTWHYYGSPIPHTIIAKSLRYTPINPDITRLNLKVILSMRSLYPTFMPPYYNTGGWGDLPYYYSKPLALVCAFCWVFPFVYSRVRAISLALFIVHIYLSYISTYRSPWYFPNVTLLSIFVLAWIVQQAIVFTPPLRAGAGFISVLQKKLNSKIALCFKIFTPLESPALKGRDEINKNLHTLLERAGFKASSFLTGFTYSFTGLVLIISLLLTITTAYQLRLRQEIIENGNRKLIGLWLRKNAASAKDTVFLEPLGYIGFYSQLKMYDFPGLSSPEVVAVRRKFKTDSFAKIILELQPDWVVLRDNEVKIVNKDSPNLLTEIYQPVKVFDVSKKVLSYRFLPGRAYLQHDQSFVIFRSRKQ